MKTSQTISGNEPLFFVGLAFVLVLAVITFILFIKRRNRSQAVEKGETWKKVTEELLFRLMFGELTMEESLKQFRALGKSNLLSKITTLSIISLHQNYTGKQREILEDFFVMSDLTSYSFRKIRSRKPSDIISGIRFLSTMNVREAFEFMRLELDHPNEEVKREAFIGLIALQGMEGLSYFKLPDFVIDHITQERILNQLKNKRFTSFSGVHLLLYSENESLILLGARIAADFQLHSYYEYIQTFSKKLQPKYQAELEAIQEQIHKGLNP